VHPGSLLSLSIKDSYTFSYLPQASHNCHMDESYRLIDIGVVNPRDESSLCFLDEMLLDDADVLYMLDVFVVSGVNCHVLSPHRESLLVLLFIFNTDDERNTRGVLFHHIDHEPHCEMHSFNHN